MLTYLSQLIRSAFDASVYAEVGDARARSAFGYVFVLACACAAFLVLFVKFRVFPAADETMEWLKPRAPVLEFTADGVVTDVLQPYDVSSRRGDLLLRVDTHGVSEISTELPRVLITKREVVLAANDDLGIEMPAQRIQVVPTTPEEKAAWTNVHFDAKWIDENYRYYRTVALLMAGLTALLLLFLWKLLALAAYAVVATGVARLLGSKAPFSSWLNIVARAVTVPTLLQIAALVGLVSPWLLFPGVGTAVTAAYTAFGARALARQALVQGSRASEDSAPA